MKLARIIDKIKRGAKKMNKAWSIVLTLCIMLSLVVTGCSSGASKTATPATPAATTTATPSAASDAYAGVPQGKWVVAFCNGMTGNAWRAAHVAAWEEEGAAMKKAGLISNYLTANVDGATAQIASISDFISKGVNAICIEADSGPALGSVITEALNAGIVVVATDPCGLTVKEGSKFIIINGDNDEYMRAPMEYLAYKMGYKGQVIHLYGLEGGWVGGEVRKATVRYVAAKYNMPIIAGIPCNWLNSKAYDATTSLLSTHGASYGGPGILVAAEDVGIGVLQAYSAAKVPFPVMIGDYTYGFLREWAKNPDLVACSNVYPPSTTRTYLYAAVLSLNNYKMDTNATLLAGIPNSITTPMPFIVVNEPQVTGKEPWMKYLMSTTKIKLLKDVVAEANAKGYKDNQTLDGWLTMQQLIDLYYVKK